MFLEFVLLLGVLASGALALLLYMGSRRRTSEHLGELAARRVLSRPEQTLYWRLVQALPEHVVLGQVAYSQMLAVKKSRDARGTRNRFDRLVADFVVCRKDFSVVAVLELDDRSHDSPRRHHVDLKKRALLDAAGLPLHRLNGAELPDEATIAELIGTTPSTRIPTQH